MAAAATSLSGRGPGHGRPPGRRRRRVLLRGTTAVAVGLASLTTPLPASATPATEPGNARPTVTDCPADIADLATCYRGQDVNGAYYAIAVPHEWNGSLVMHAHGGPDLEPEGSDPERSVDDLERWTVMVEEGYAWAGSSYRRGGYGVRMAAEDTETLRQLYVDHFGQPRRTFVHGQSWGGNVAAKIAEIDAARERPAYDGALLTNGLVAGGSRGYDYRVDLRVVYQYYCGNHPRPTEPQYPLWMGLPENSTMTQDDLRARLDECTGYSSRPQERTAGQQQRLDDILAVTRIPERSLASHLNWATFTFRDIVHNRLDGRNPFGNRGVRYTGSHDDKALNAGVERFTADRSARRDLSYDSDLTGAVSMPVLSLHAIGDPTVFVEHESAYLASLEGAGTDEHLVQTFTTETEHSSLSDAEYANSIAALSTWVTTGRKPTPRAIAATCPSFDAVYGTGCHYRPDHRPADYHSRMYPRPGERDWPALTAEREEHWSHRPGVGIEP